MCKNKQIFNKEKICISQNLGLCKGCDNSFFEDLEKEGWSGLKITDKGITKFGVDVK